MIPRMLHFFHSKKHVLLSAYKGYIWFICGVVIGFFFFISFSYITYKQNHSRVIYPGVYINGIDMGNKTKEEVRTYFADKNDEIQKSKFIFTTDTKVATVSAKEIRFGYNETLLSEQAFSIGRTSDFFSDISLMLQAYLHGVYLSPSYHYDEDSLGKLLKPITDDVYKEPIDARFTFKNNRVQEFRQSEDGKTVDTKELKSRIEAKTLTIVSAEKPQTITIPLPVKILKPKVTTEQVNNLGVKELIGTGSSLFIGSIPNRMYNIALAATRLNGILIKPGEVFSFVKAIGDISTFTGYKQAYVIQNGRTVLGDGGGVCQVSTTLFRAVLNTGLQIVERNPHAYRVGYYEQDSGPGIDAAIYVPTVDFKFKNDTAYHILLQTIVDPDSGKLTFNLYGTNDKREVIIGKPVITSVTSSPEPLYIDDPTLPRGQEKQVDFAVPGANVFFTRTVKKDGKVILNDKFTSVYRAWQAVYMRGTKDS